MIIGNGNIATAIKDSGINHEQLLIIAAGVSDSTTTNKQHFMREKEMIQKALKQNKSFKVVYFNTYSKKKNSVYIKHKCEMMNLISNHTSKYLFIALPIVCGKSNNNKQLIPWLMDSLINDKIVSINPNARRYIISSEIIPRCIELLRNTDFKNAAILSKRCYHIKDIMYILEKTFNKKFKLAYNNDEKYIYIPADHNQFEYIQYEESSLEVILNKYYT